VDAEGGFMISAVPPGVYVVEAQAAGHVGQSTKVEVRPEEESVTRFILSPLAVIEPHVVVRHRATIIHYGGTPASALFILVPYGLACSDNCTWWERLVPGTERVLLEVTGKHSMSNPRGNDGLHVIVRAYEATTSDFRYLHTCRGGPLDPCLHLPKRIEFGPEDLNTANSRVAVVDRLRIEFWCEDGWVCLDDRYDSWLSFFVDWTGREIPPEYTATGGT
jgi:hypothetical protein